MGNECLWFRYDMIDLRTFFFEKMCKWSRMSLKGLDLVTVILHDLCIGLHDNMILSNLTTLDFGQLSQFLWTYLLHSSKRMKVHREFKGETWKVVIMFLVKKKQHNVANSSKW